MATNKTAPRIARDSKKDTDRKQQEDLQNAMKGTGIETAKTHTCTVCGSSTRVPGRSFYATSFAKNNAQNSGFSLICKNCIKEFYAQYFAETGNAYTALQICCHYLDIPYIQQAAEKCLKGKSAVFPIPMYMKELLLPAYRKLSYADSIIETAYAMTPAETNEEKEKSWDKESLQNMSYIKNIVGYDPFDDSSLTAEDRKFLFNTMAGYCPDSSIANDSHKLNSIIVIVKHLLQANKVTELINRELAKPLNKQQDIDKLANIQKTFHQTIDRMAEKNNISKSKDTNQSSTLTGRMQMLMQDEFRDIEVNMYDIEQSEQLLKLEKMSMEAVKEAIHLEDNDYSDIINEQREIIDRLNKENKGLAEKVRVLTNQLNAGSFKEA